MHHPISGSIFATVWSLAVFQIAAVSQDTYKLTTSTSLPLPDVRFRPPIGNGHVATNVLSDTIYMNGVFNGREDASSRARIPSTVSVDVNYPADVNLDKTYELDMRKGLFKQTIVGPDVTVAITYLAHRVLPRIMAAVVDVRRRNTATGSLSIPLTLHKGNDTIDFHLTTEEHGDDCYTHGPVNITELPKMEKTNIHQIWTKVPTELELPAGQDRLVMSFVTSLSMQKADAEAQWKAASAMVDNDRLIATHVEEMEKLWRDGEIEIEDNRDLAQTIHAAMYHIFCSLPTRPDPIMPFYGLSPGGLSRGGLLHPEKVGGGDNDYAGHVFWDMDTWIMPPIMLFHPEMAKIMIGARTRVIDQVKENAKEAGMEGVKFPWEQAITGMEATPKWAGNMSKYQIHIVADVSYALRQYLYVTHDRDILHNHKGLILAFEIARFWKSRVTRMPSGQYEILRVMGPDEDHFNINNSVFTNYNAKLSLLLPQYIANELHVSLNASLKREIQEFNDIANNILILFDDTLQYHPQYEDFSLNQIIKQSDAVLLGFPLLMDMPEHVRRNDLVLYENITKVNGPDTGTWSMHTVGWLELGDEKRAAKNFRMMFRNINGPFKVFSEKPVALTGTGGCVNFITGAGGLLQSVVFGYGGIRFRKDRMDINPTNLPNTTAWAMKGIKYKGVVIDVSISGSVKTINVTSLPDTGYVEMEERGQWTRRMVQGREETFTHSIRIRVREQFSSYLLTSDTLSEDVRFRPPIGNGHVATNVLSDTIYMNGVYNGREDASSRARIPSTVSVDVNFPVGTDVTRHYKLDMRKALFMQYIQKSDVSITITYLAHRAQPRIMAAVVDVRRLNNVPGTIQIPLTVNKGTETEDFRLNTTDYQGHKYTHGPVNITELPGMKVNVLHQFWTTIPTELTLSAGQSTLVKAFITSLSVDKDDAEMQYHAATNMTPEELISSHAEEMEKIWADGEIIIEHNMELAKTMHAAMYNLLCSLPSHPDPVLHFYGLSPGGLSRGGLSHPERPGGPDNDYAGHVFWDMDTWMLPPIMVFHPVMARMMIGSRTHVIEQVKKNAKAAGMEGAKFPWEQAMTGIEATPKWAGDVSRYEIHIMADIAYALRQYLYATNDIDLVVNKNGLLLALELARYWKSRSTLMPSGNYEILSVMGPDEYHYNINNSVYTNYNAKLSLLLPQYIADMMRISFNDSLAQENKEFVDVANKLVILFDEKQQYHPQYEGFNLSLQIKQSDVVLLGYPLLMDMPPDIRRNDLELYENITDPAGPTVGTWSMHTVGWLELGEQERAAKNFRMMFRNIHGPFKVFSETPVSNTSHGGAVNFITGAGGLLQSIVFGYGGIRFRKDRMDINPTNLPNTTAWSMKGVKYKGVVMDVSISGSVKTINVTALPDTRYVEMEERGKWPRRMVQGMAETFTHNISILVSEQSRGAIAINETDGGSYLLTSNTLSEDVRFRPPIGNGHVATNVLSDTIYMNGVYNGRDDATSRARIPSTVSIDVNYPAGTDVTRHYELNMRKALFMQYIQKSDVSITVTYLAHRAQPRIMAAVVDVRRRNNVPGTITIPLTVNKGNETQDFRLTTTDYHGYQDHKYTHGPVNITELPGMKVNVLHQFWTTIPTELTLSAGQSTLVKAFITSLSVDKDDAEMQYRTAIDMTPEELISSHAEEMEKIWADGEIIIEHNTELAKTMHAAMYNLLCSLPSHPDPVLHFYGLSPGGLSRGGLSHPERPGGPDNDYAGHVFWDMDTWMLPPIMVFHPVMARMMIGSRTHVIEQVKKNAKAAGMEGAKFPWEQAMTGIEATPKWAGDVSRYEIHIMADIAFALRQYLYATNDIDLVVNENGLLLALELARYWKSRSTLMPSGNYEILSVMGPDEYHYNINNSVYTNYNAKLTLLLPQYIADMMRISFNDSLAQENKEFVDVANKLVILFDEKQQYHPQYEGFNLSLQIKQSDVVLLGYPLLMDMPPDIRRNDLELYENITDPAGPTVGTWSMHTVGWLELGEQERAAKNFRMMFRNIHGPFKVFSETPVSNTSHGGAVNFITGAGGLLQSIVFGYGGIRFRKDRMDINLTKLPNTTAWSMKGIKYKGVVIDVSISGSMKTINVTSLPDTRYVEMEESDQWTRRMVQGREETFTYSIRIRVREQSSYLLTSDTLSEDVRFRPPIGNGHVATNVLSDTIYMNGVYNGREDASSRARIPSTVSVDVNFPVGTDVTRHYELDMRKALFMQYIQKSDVSITITYLAHRAKPRIMAAVVDVRRLNNVPGTITIPLTVNMGNETRDFRLTTTGYQGDKYTHGPVNITELPGMKVNILHQFWTTIPTELTLSAGQSTLVKAFITSLSVDKDDAEMQYRAATDMSPEELMSSHAEEMEKIWEDGEIIIEHNMELAKTLHAAMYNLLCSLPSRPDPVLHFYGLSPGGLSRGGLSHPERPGGPDNDYAGHVFWDMDTWMLPPIMVFHPVMARMMIGSRTHVIEQVKKNAKAAGMEGAKFPWEQAMTGIEATPKWAGDVSRYEIHIMADIAYALRQYLYATNDIDLVVNDNGLLLALELARYWKSRSTLMPSGNYEILSVMGPDEYHYNINNSVYTNYNAKLSLLLPQYIADMMRISFNDSLDQENKEFVDVANKLVILFDEKLQYHPQYEGFNLSLQIKQSDVVLLGYPLLMDMPPDIRRNDLELYENITDPAGPTVGTWSMHTVGWLELGEQERAAKNFRMMFRNIHGPFKVFSETPVSNTSHGGAVNFITGAGGLLQSIVFGYGGIRFRKDRMDINLTKLPNTTAWSMKGIKYKGVVIDVSISGSMKTINVTSLPDTRYVEMEESDQWTRRMVQGREETFTYSIRIRVREQSSYLLTSDTLSEDVRFRPPIGNGHVATNVLSDTIYMNGVYNGREDASSRARIPSTVSVDVNFPVGTDVTRHYELDMRKALFMQYIQKSDVSITITYLAHRAQPRIMAAVVDVRRLNNVPGTITIPLTVNMGNETRDFRLTTTGYQGDKYTHGPVNITELPGMKVNILHQFWTTIPTELTLSAGQSTLVKAFITSLSVDKDDAEMQYRAATDMSPEELMSSHAEEMEKIWADGEIIIEHNTELAKTLHAAMYNLLCSLPSHPDPVLHFYGLSPGGLSRGGLSHPERPGGPDNDYAGHVFWDMDTWMLPPIMVFHPVMARMMIGSRTHVIEQVKKNAKAAGMEGAKFPWEQAMTGIEATPKWAGDVSRYEIHIMADIAYALRQYLYATNDIDLVVNKNGLLLALELARYWKSRSTLMPSGNYEILSVMGPDEYHYNINNSVYTNYNAKLSLLLPQYIADWMRISFNDSLAQENKEFVDVANKLVILFDEKQQYHPQYEGFNLSLQIKQSDVVLLGYPLLMDMTPDIRRNDLELYENITDPAGPTVGTWSMHTVGWLELGEQERAANNFRMMFRNIHGPFKVFSETPVSNISHGGAVNFITGAGGLLQSIVFGYGGIRFRKDRMDINPTNIPNTTAWSMKGVKYKGVVMDVSISGSVKTINVTALPDTRYVEMEERGKWPRRMVQGMAETFTHNIRILVSERSRGAIAINETDGGSYLLTSNTLSEDVRFRPPIGNGHVATNVLSDTIYMNGVYNGREDASSRARIPSTVSIDVNYPAGTDVTRHYELNMRKALFMQYIQKSDVSITVTYLAHRAQPRIMAAVVDVRRRNNVPGTITIPLTVNKGNETQDFRLTTTDYQGHKYTHGPVNITELPGMKVNVLHQFWTTIPTELTLSAGQSTLVKAFITSLSVDKDDAEMQYRAATDTTPQELISSHAEEMEKIWADGEIIIEHNTELAKTLHAAMYNLLCSLPSHPDPVLRFYGLSPGGLSRGGLSHPERPGGPDNDYAGHVFWDMDTWMLPPIMVFHPVMARMMIGSRTHVIEQVKKNAKAAGMEGAKFPWEQAMTGIEATPKWAGDVSRYEIHIMADIAYALRQYLYATNDIDLVVNDNGLLLALELARYWKSRSTLMPSGNYEILSVMGPDEYHYNINNSVYTNYNAKLSLLLPQYIADWMRISFNDSLAQENKEFVDVANKLVILFDEKQQYHPQYEGFNLSLQIKQSDVVLLGYPLLMDMPPDIRRNDLELYENITDPAGPTVGTWSMHTVGWLELGEQERAAKNFRMMFRNIQGPFKVFSETPVSNTSHGGAVNFITGAGGLLQSMLFGYGGIRYREDRMDVNPTILPHSTSYIIRGIKYRGATLNIKVEGWLKTIELTEVPQHAVVYMGIPGHDWQPMMSAYEIMIRGKVSIKVEVEQTTLVPGVHVITTHAPTTATRRASIATRRASIATHAPTHRPSTPGSGSHVLPTVFFTTICAVVCLLVQI